MMSTSNNIFLYSLFFLFFFIFIVRYAVLGNLVKVITRDLGQMDKNIVCEKKAREMKKKTMQVGGGRKLTLIVL